MRCGAVRWSVADGVRCRAAAGTVQRRRRVWLLCASVVHGLARVWCVCDVCVCEALCGGEGAGECGRRVVGDLTDMCGGLWRWIWHRKEWLCMDGGPTSCLSNMECANALMDVGLSVSLSARR